MQSHRAVEPRTAPDFASDVGLRQAIAALTTATARKFGEFTMRKQVADPVVEPRWLNVDAAARYLCMSVLAIYHKISRRQIP